MNPQIRIFLLDDHEIVRRGIRDLFEAEVDLAEKTVKNYVSNILMKSGLERRTRAAVLASKLIR